MNTASVCVVIFAFNEEAFIGEQIDSIAAQTIAPRQIVFVDDHSTDRTLQIAQHHLSKFKEKIGEDCNITITKNTYGKGKCKAYSLGCGLAKEKWICVAAGDDKLPPNYIEKNIEFLNKRNFDFCLNNFFVCDDKLNIIKIQKIPKFANDGIFYRNYMSGYLFIRKESLEKILPLPDDLQFEDWFVNMWLYETFGILPSNTSCPFYYRRHANAATFIAQDSLSTEKKAALNRRSINTLSIYLRDQCTSTDSRHRIESSMTCYKYLLSEKSIFDLIKSKAPLTEILRFIRRRI